MTARKSPEEALNEAWEHTLNQPRTTPHRLELIFRNARKVYERGPETDHAGELNLDYAISKLGYAGVLRQLAHLVDDESAT